MRSHFKLSAALILVLCSAFMTACTINPPAPEVAVLDDNFRPFVEYTTRPREVFAYPNSVVTRLVAHIDRKTGARYVKLGVGYSYVGAAMRKYRDARNARAERLRFQKGSRNRSCKDHRCIFTEHFTIEVPEEELRAAPASGYELKVFARSGHATKLTVHKADIDALFLALDNSAPQVATSAQ